MSVNAEVAEVVDATVSKTVEEQSSCRFESDLRHQRFEQGGGYLTRYLVDDDLECITMQGKEDRRLKEIIDSFTCDKACDKDCQCYQSGLENLCKAQDVGITSFLVCLEKETDCQHRISYGDSYYCKCPLRLHIKRELGK